MNKPTASPGTVLVLDDDVILRRSVVRILELEGYEVIAAEDAHEALVLSNGYAGSIDLLLCDLVLPGLGGREAANLLLARRPDMSVLYTSGYSGHATARANLLAGGEAFLPKPFELNEMVSAVGGLITQTGSAALRT